MKPKDPKAPAARPASAGDGSPSPSQAKPNPPNAKPKPPASSAKKRMPTWLRLTLRVLRTIAIPLLCLLALVIGVLVGYGYVGGRDYGDVWSLDTWKHLFELVFAE